MCSVMFCSSVRLNSFCVILWLPGTDNRINYLIRKGGSEALLTALVKTARCFSPNYTILVPLLHLLAKVGQRGNTSVTPLQQCLDCFSFIGWFVVCIKTDRRIGMKAEHAGAVLLTLNLLKHNIKHARRVAACLWVLQVFASSGLNFFLF